MSIVESSTKKNGVAGATDTPTLTPEQVVDQLRALRQQIPEFVQLPNDRELKQIRRTVNLNAEFAHEAFSAVGASEIVQTAIGNTPADLHVAEDEVARWATVESELRSMLRGLTVANLIRRHRLYQAALQAYNVSKQLVRQEDHANLLPHVESMIRIRKFSRRRAKPAAAAPQPQPATPTLATTPQTPKPQ
jgi:hypothetical protein